MLGLIGKNATLWQSCVFLPVRYAQQTYLNFLLVKRDATHDVETRRLVGFRIGVIRGFKDSFVLGTADRKERENI